MTKDEAIDVLRTALQQCACLPKQAALRAKIADKALRATATIEAQPAADPAPVPAQGIDHAKLDERAAFEVWIATALRKAYPHMPEDSVQHKLWKRGDGTYKDLQTQHDWAAWQARGQQAGGAEGGIDGPEFQYLIGKAYAAALESDEGKLRSAEAALIAFVDQQAGRRP